MNPIVCIAGPTASGKSAWAIDIAKTFGGEIINADAMQVYSDLHIISARPSLDEMGNIPHHLFGHIDGQTRYSVGMWLRDVEPLIIDVLARGNVPILVGGTGLYFRALTQGLAAVPPVVTGSAENFLKESGIEALRNKATALDPVAAARVLGDDPQRLIRIVSVAEQTKKTLSEWQAETCPIVPRGFWLGATLMPNRSALYEKINARFDVMVEQGGLDEIKALFQRNLPADLPVMRAIGVSQFTSYLSGHMSLEEAVSMAKRDSRRLAKRQFTWFRGQMKGQGWAPIEDANQKDKFVQAIKDKIDELCIGL